jgi:hypothetical protein
LSEPKKKAVSSDWNITATGHPLASGTTLLFGRRAIARIGCGFVVGVLAQARRAVC